MRWDHVENFSEGQVARCTVEQAQQLIDFDHHAVRVAGRLGVMLTFPWMERLVQGERLAEPLELVVIFEHAAGHPLAPWAVQAVIDRLEFQPLAGAADSRIIEE